MFKRRFWRELRQTKFVTPSKLTDEQLHRIADLRQSGARWIKVEAELNLAPNCCHYVAKLVKERTGRDIVKTRAVRNEKPAPEVVVAPKLSRPAPDHLEYDIVTLVRRGHSRQYIAAKTRAPYAVIEAAFKRYAPNPMVLT